MDTLATSIPLTLDIVQSGVQKILHVQQGEVNARALVIRLRNGATPLPLEPTDYAALRAVSGEHCIFDDCRVENGAALCPLSPQILAIAGTVECELSVYGISGQLLYSPRFTLDVAPSPLFGDAYVEASDEFTALTTAMLGYLNAQSQVDAAEAVRSAAEGLRAEAESDRATAEQTRQAAEAERVTAEIARTDAELTRSGEEEDRAAAEAARVETEALRANAETGRVTAETGREAAEAARAAQFGTVLTQAEGSATAAAGSAMAAAGSATTAAGSAAAAAESAQAAGEAVSGHNASPDAHGNLFATREAVANKVTTLSPTATDAQYPSAKCVYTAIQQVRDAHYTVRWDKVNAQMVRLNSAEGITTDTTHFSHRGSKNAALANPFDSLYPWSGIRLCNISLDAYRALTAGDSVLDCVRAWLGDVDFSYSDACGVWQYRPQFWYKWWDDARYRYYDVSPRFFPGYIHAPARIKGRWHGRNITLSIDGTDKTCLIPSPGMPGKFVPMTTLHANAKNYGAGVEDIYDYDADTALYIVEYADWNTQRALGNGVTSLYRQSSDLIQEAATASATVKILKSAKDAVIPNAIFDIGTNNGGAQVGSYIVVSVADDPDDATLSIVTLKNADGTPASITATTAHMWSVHGLINLADADIGADSGYIGVNGRSNVYYRGQVFFGNLWRYILGIYRQSGTGHVWLAADSNAAGACDALNTAVHEDTGIALPQGDAGAAREGYIQALAAHEKLGAPPICATAGGNSTNPVGDYCWVPALTANDTILLAGGFASSGANAGRAFGAWTHVAGYSYWNGAAVPILKNP